MQESLAGLKELESVIAKKKESWQVGAGGLPRGGRAFILREVPQAEARA